MKELIEHRREGLLIKLLQIMLVVLMIGFVASFIISKVARLVS